MKKPESSAPLQQIFAAAYCQLAQRKRAPEIHACFYPFAGLSHTIRSRNQRIYARVSDILRDAPLAIHQAVAHILVARLLKQRSAPKHKKAYEQYAYQPAVQHAIALARQQREPQPPANPVGDVYDLAVIFARLNRRYFNHALAQPALRWSQRQTKRLLGHHDYAHDAIIISRWLDRATVPLCVVEYLLYHEMLHLKHQPHVANGRRIYHTAAFRADERRFADYDKAVDWIERIAG